MNVNGGLLAGSGGVGNGNNLLTVNPGGTIGAGANAATAGTLTSGAQTWASNSTSAGTYAWKLTGAVNGYGTPGAAPGSGGSGAIGGGTGVEGIDWDQLSMSSSNASTLDLSQAGGTNASFNIAVSTLGSFNSGGSSYSWVIAQVAGNNSILLPGSPTVGTASGGTVSVPGTDLTTYSPTGGGGSYIFALNTNGFTDNGGAVTSSAFTLEAMNIGGNEDLVLDYTATPEPGTTILVLCGAVPMLMGRRRRRKLI